MDKLSLDRYDPVTWSQMSGVGGKPPFVKLEWSFAGGGAGPGRAGAGTGGYIAPGMAGNWA